MPIVVEMCQLPDFPKYLEQPDFLLAILVSVGMVELGFDPVGLLDFRRSRPAH